MDKVPSPERADCPQRCVSKSLDKLPKYSGRALRQRSQKAIDEEPHGLVPFVVVHNYSENCE